MVDELLLQTQARVVAVEEESRLGEGLITSRVDEEMIYIGVQVVEILPHIMAFSASPTVFVECLHTPHAFKPILGIVVAEEEVDQPT